MREIKRERERERDMERERDRDRESDGVRERETERAIIQKSLKNRYQFEMFHVNEKSNLTMFYIK